MFVSVRLFSEVFKGQRHAFNFSFALRTALSLQGKPPLMAHLAGENGLNWKSLNWTRYGLWGRRLRRVPNTADPLSRLSEGQSIPQLSSEATHVKVPPMSF